MSRHHQGLTGLKGGAAERVELSDLRHRLAHVRGAGGRCDVPEGLAGLDGGDGGAGGNGGVGLDGARGDDADGGKDDRSEDHRAGDDGASHDAGERHEPGGGGRGDDALRGAALRGSRGDDRSVLTDSGSAGTHADGTPLLAIFVSALLLFSVAQQPFGSLLTTEAVAVELARSFVGGIAIALSVPLTTGIAAGLGVRGRVTSPTFVIARVHPSLVGGPELVHVDAYRLGGSADLEDLDLEADLDDAVTVVEWGRDRVEHLNADQVTCANSSTK